MMTAGANRSASASSFVERDSIKGLELSGKIRAIFFMLRLLKNLTYTTPVSLFPVNSGPPLGVKNHGKRFNQNTKYSKRKRR